jgi:hypothetical protein
VPLTKSLPAFHQPFIGISPPATTLRIMVRLSLITLTVAALIGIGLAVRDPSEPDAAAAHRVALQWTAAERADVPRRVAEGWEIDVRRADGSLVEITLGPDLELRELDEERGTGGTAAHDEVMGALRTRAVAAARAVAGPGPLRGVERERDGSIEVDVLARDGTVVEVELDGRLGVADVDREDVGDE